MSWLSQPSVFKHYHHWMDGREFEDLETKYLTITKMIFDYDKGHISTEVGRLVDLRAVNLS